MATQTRKEYYDLCKSKGWPLPEIVNANTSVGKDPQGRQLMAAEADHNDQDYREYDPETGEAGPWQRPGSQSRHA